MADHNRRFGKEPLSPHDVHRPLPPTDDRGCFLCWQEERRLTSNIVRRCSDVVRAERMLTSPARRLRQQPPGASASLEEGL
jgi:hypothetical protein